MRRKVSIQVNLCVMLRLIRVDSLRIVYNVGFLAERLICRTTNYKYSFRTIFNLKCCVSPIVHEWITVFPIKLCQYDKSILLQWVLSNSILFQHETQRSSIIRGFKRKHLLELSLSHVLKSFNRRFWKHLGKHFFKLENNF